MPSPSTRTCVTLRSRRRPSARSWSLGALPTADLARGCLPHGVSLKLRWTIYAETIPRRGAQQRSAAADGGDVATVLAPVSADWNGSHVFNDYVTILKHWLPGW